MVDTFLGVVGHRVWGQHRGGAGILKAEAALESEERKAFWPPCLETLTACSSPNEPLRENTHTHINNKPEERL